MSMPRRSKSNRQQRRSKPRFEPRDRMLIICEGTKSEKLYFENARQVIGVDPGLAVVEIHPGEGSNPKNIVNTAQRLKNDAKNNGNAFSSVYCVFDRDEHAHYQESVERAEKLKIKTIRSVPCFEYWILLHFRNHTAPYARSGDRSPCACCLRDVKQEWSDYSKGLTLLYSKLQDRLPNARKLAEQRLAAAQAEGGDNPSTEIHLLLDAIEALKQPKEVASQNSEKIVR